MRTMELRMPCWRFLQVVAAGKEWNCGEGFKGIKPDFVNIVRKSGDDWYQGIICDGKCAAEFELDFLGDGTYTAYIYKDGEDPMSDVTEEIQNVTRGDLESILRLYDEMIDHTDKIEIYAKWRKGVHPAAEDIRRYVSWQGICI